MRVVESTAKRSSLAGTSSSARRDGPACTHLAIRLTKPCESSRSVPGASPTSWPIPNRAMRGSRLGFEIPIESMLDLFRRPRSKMDVGRRRRDVRPRALRLRIESRGSDGTRTRAYPHHRPAVASSIVAGAGRSGHRRWTASGRVASWRATSRNVVRLARQVCAERAEVAVEEGWGPPSKRTVGALVEKSIVIALLPVWQSATYRHLQNQTGSLRSG
jgi:hypothetical protein